jgi:hypothetical protein
MKTKTRLTKKTQYEKMKEDYAKEILIAFIIAFLIVDAIFLFIFLREILTW